MNFPTHIPDIDTEILSTLDNLSLTRWCSIDKYLNGLCNSDALWKIKIQREGFPLVQCQGCSWKDSYIRYRNAYLSGAYLVAANGSVTRIFSTFEEAYDYFIDNILSNSYIFNTSPHFIKPKLVPFSQIHDLANIYQNATTSWPGPAGIYLIEKSEQLSLTDASKALIVVDNSRSIVMPWTSAPKGANIFINPNISNMIPRHYYVPEKYTIIVNELNIILLKTVDDSIISNTVKTLTGYRFVFLVNNATKKVYKSYTYDNYGNVYMK